MTSKVIAAQSPAKTASHSALLLDVGKPMVKDCLVMDPSGMVRTILMSVPCCLKLRLHSESILRVGRRAL